MLSRRSASSESRVVDFFRDLWGFPQSSKGCVVVDPDVVAMRSAAATLGDPVVYASGEVRVSVLRAAREMGLVVRIVGVDDRGRIDCADLANCMVDAPAIVVANIGTAFSGVVDSVEDIQAVLGVAHGHRSWVHGDASILGTIVPFIPERSSILDGLDSASVSGDAFEAPFPCAVYVSRRDGQVLDSDRAKAEYLDEAATGTSVERLRREALARIENAQYLVDTAEPHWRAWRDVASPFVVMDMPPEDVVFRWNMMTSRKKARADVTRHLSKRHVNLMTRDLRAAVPVALRCTRSIIHRFP